MKQPFIYLDYIRRLQEIQTSNAKYMFKVLKVMFDLKMIDIATITKSFSMTDLCNFPTVIYII